MTYRLPFLLVALVFASLLNAAHAQQPMPAKNTIYLQLGGNAIAYSLNYERLFNPKVSGRIGFMYLSFDASDLEDIEGFEDEEDTVTATFVPVMANYLMGPGRHKAELGAGALFLIDGDGIYLGATATLGYAYRPDRGFNARIGFTPAFGPGYFLPWGGIGLGYSF